MFKFSNFDSRTQPRINRRAAVTRHAAVQKVGVGMGPQGMISAPGGIRTPSTVRNQTGNPLLDNSLIDSWIPLDNMGLHQLWRRLYLRDPVAGPAVDFWRELPWSDFTLTGVEDKKQLKVFQDCLNALHITNWLPDITAEFLTLGKVCLHFLWNSSKGYWDDLIIHNPDHIEVAKSPVVNAPLKVDLKPTDEHLNFINSTDPRDVAARKELDPAVLRLLTANQPIPLDPKNTIYLPRRAFAYDVDGISIYSRIVYLVALERPLFTASILASRRRAGPVTQITAGNEEWEPNPDELDALATAWLEAEEDAVSAVFVTRPDVQINRAVSSLASDLWKISDEYQFLVEAKMKALGISDAFLSGDANFNTMEMALSVLLERIRSHRALITNMIIREKILKEVAIANDFVKRSQAELDHRVREGSSASKVRNAAETSDEEELIIPTLNWHKHLKPNADESMIQLLAAAEEHGLPVMLRDWASATNINLDAGLKQMDEDFKTRKKISAYKQKVMSLGGGQNGDGFGGFGGEGGEEGMPDVQPPGEGGEEATAASVRNARRAKTRESTLQEFAQKLPIWDQRGFCLDLHREELCDLLHNDKFRAALVERNSWEEVFHTLCEMDLSPRKAEIVGYVLFRRGLVTGFQVPTGLVQAIADRVKGENAQNFKVLRELEVVQAAIKANESLTKGELPKVAVRENNIPASNLLTGNQPTHG